MTHPIRLHPSYFGPNTDAFIRERLYADVEGTCTGTEGYIVAVLSITEVGAGTVEPGSGAAEFNVRYSAIVFRPFKGEVLDGTIVTVNKVRGVRATIADARSKASSPRSARCRSTSPHMCAS